MTGHQRIVSDEGMVDMCSCGAIARGCPELADNEKKKGKKWRRR